MNAIIVVSSPVRFALILCLPLLLSLAQPAPSGAEYYVDSTHPRASDVNPGTAALPWRNCPGMPDWSGSQELAAGDTVYFLQTGVWEVADAGAGLQVVGGVTYEGNTWSGSGPGGFDRRAVIRATGPIVRSMVNFMDDHPDMPTIVRGFELDSNGQVVTGVGINWPHMQADLVGDVKRVENCAIHDVHSRQADGEYEYGIVVSSWLGYQVANVEILDSEIYNISRAGLCNYLGNDVPENRSENVVFHGNVIHDTGLDDTGSSGSGIALKNHAVDALVEYNTIYDTVIGINVTTHPEPGFRGPENAVIRHNIVRDTDHVCLWFANGGDKSVDVYGNLIFNCKYEGLRVASSVADRLSLRIFNNTFFHNYRQEWSHDVRIESNSANVSALEFTNNIVHSSSFTRSLGDDDGDLTSHRNNLYYRDGGGTLVTTMGDRYSADDLADWEPSALLADPLLLDPTGQPPIGFWGRFGRPREPSPDGMSIQLGSPAHNAGVDLGVGFASSVNSLIRGEYGPWDVGAYELIYPDTEWPTGPIHVAVYLPFLGSRR